MRAFRLLLPTALLLAWLAVLPASTDAICATAPMPDALRDAPVVFIGIVTATENRGATATFLVKEIWRGPTLTPLIKVHGADPGTTEEGLTWQEGVEYVVMPRLVGDRLEDHACSNSRPWTEDLAAFRPSDARQPVDQVPTSGPPGDPPYAMVFLLILAGGAAAAFLLLRRR